MTKRIDLLLIIWTLLGLGLAQTSSELVGTWEGVLEQEGENLSIIVRLEQAETWQGSIDIPRQDVTAQPLINIVVKGDAIKFEIENLAASEGPAVFEGTLLDSKITGTLSQGRQDTALTLEPQTAETNQSRLTEAQILELGQAFTQQLYNGDYESLAQRFTDDMREAMDATALEQLWQQLKGQIGGEAELLGETVMFQMGLGVYQRSARFGNGEKAIVQWVINDEGIIEGFTIRPDRSG